MTAMCQSKSCQLQRNSVGTRGKEKPACIPPGYTPRHLLIIVDLSVIGSRASSAAFALLVLSRRTRVSGKCTRGKCPGGNVRSQNGQCPFHCVLVLSTEVLEGRPRVLHLRLSSASWMNAQNLLHIGHFDEKNCVD